MFSSTTKAQKTVLFYNKDQEVTFAQQIKNGLACEIEVVFIGLPTGHLLDSSFDLALTKGLEIDKTLDIFFEVFRILKPEGKFYCFSSDRTFEISEKLSSNLTIAGFADTTITQDGNDAVFISSKPNWESGATQGISLKKKANVDWSNNNNDELMDASDLLSEQDLIKPDLSSVSDCKTAKKACANCSCGRAEMETQDSIKKQKVTLEMLENPGVGSSCGSCGLGDAFRCAGCPYAGLPAFKEGEKIVLPDDYFQDDI
jgi:hypothetical protein